MSIEELINQIKTGDDRVRGEAWQGAGPSGPKAVKPLMKLMAEGEMEVSRSAKRATWKIVRYVGRPDGGSDRAAVVKELIDLLSGDQPVAVRREVLWMVSEICSGAEAVPAVAALISNKDLREDARMVLQRIPGDESLSALKKALGEVPENFKLNIAQSLRARGVEVPGHPCQKLVPTKPTKVKPVGR